jgi:chaperonin GroES
MKKKQSKSTRTRTGAKKTIKPFGDRILVKPYSQEEVSGNKNHHGIIIPETIEKEKSAQGKVLAVGEGKYLDGKLVPMRVRVGETVVFSKYGYDEVEQNGEELYLIKEDNILAVIR